MSIKLRHELAKPCGAIRPNRKNLSVTVFCHENKSVVIVEKNLASSQYGRIFEDIFETMRKSSFDIFGGDIVSTAFYAVFDSPNTFLGSVQNRHSTGEYSILPPLRVCKAVSDIPQKELSPA